MKHLEAITEIIKNTNNGEKIMGKPKRPKPTNKDFEMEYKFNAFDNLFGLYLKWKKDQDKFQKFVEFEARKLSKESKPNEDRT